MMRCEENPIINVSMIAISTMLHCYSVTNDTVGGKILAIVFVGAISTMLNCHSLMLLDDDDNDNDNDGDGGDNGDHDVECW